MSWGDHQRVKAKLQRLWRQGALLRQDAPSRFPLRIPLAHPKGQTLVEDYDAARRWIQRLCQEAERAGYQLEWKTINHRQLGRNQLPVAASIPDLATALRILGKGTEARRHAELHRTLTDAFPELAQWAETHPHELLEQADHWPRLIQLLAWMKAHPRPNLYLREVDLPGIHTKFIERHRGLLSRLLDIILPPEAIDAEARGVGQFERRYGFRQKPPLIRFRLLDPRLTIAGLTDLTIPLADFARLETQARTLFIVENDITGLSFPPVPGGMVILGRGYGVELLGQVPWLADRALWYWSDLDSDGFAMLHRLRRHFPKVRSLLMDEATLLAHRHAWGEEPNPRRRTLDRLTDDEQRLYQRLLDGHYRPRLRLEQEQIAMSWLRQALEKLLLRACRT